jgi:hypothetical protein
VKRRRFATALSCAAAACAPLPAMAGLNVELGDWTLNVGGYVRQHLSWNTEDQPETLANDRGDLSMSRTSLRLDSSISRPGFAVTSSLRLAREQNTAYLKRLQDPAAFAAPGSAAGWNGATGAGAGLNRSLTKIYKQSELRELYADIDVLPARLDLRLGKQQVAFGEADFVQALDLLHGYDFRYRGGQEDNDEARKPLIMGVANVQVPEANGNVQVAIRPGWDRKKDIGTDFDIFGGRWAQRNTHGIDFNTVLDFDHDHPKGGYKDPTGGIRWRGKAGDFSYQFAFVRSFNLEPILNPAPALFGFFPSSSATNGGYGGKLANQTALGSLVFPHVNTIGAAGNTFVDAAGIVVAAELAYTKNRPYNYGTYGASQLCPPLGPVGLPVGGACGVIEKDTVRTMVRLEKTARWTQNVLGSDDATIFFLQIFDTWIRNFKASEEIVPSLGSTKNAKAHSPVVVFGTINGLNYVNSRVSLGGSVLVDTNDGGMQIKPTLALKYGNNARVLFEYIRFTGGKNGLGALPQTYFPSTLRGDSQFTVRMDWLL